MRRGKTRRLLAVFRNVYHPPVAIFGVRPDGQFEESAVRCTEADDIRSLLITMMSTASASWDERFEYLSERMPRPMTCEYYDVPTWVTPSMLHCIGYLLETLPYGYPGGELVKAMRAFAAGEAPIEQVRALEALIPVKPDEWGIVPPVAAVLRTFWHLTGHLSTEQLRQLEAVDVPAKPAD